MFNRRKTFNVGRGLHVFHSEDTARLAEMAERVGLKMMPAWLQQFINSSKTNQNLANATETTIATVQVNNPSGIAAVLYGLAVITVGAAATSLTLRIRADSITGGAVNNPVAQNVVASTTASYVAVGISASGEMAERTFVLTATVAGGAAAGTAVECALVANSF